MRSFLRIPPFPNHRAPPLAVAEPSARGSEAEAVELIAALAATHVGGSFWAARPALPPGRTLLLAPDTPAQARALLDEAAEEGLAACAVLAGPWAARHGVPVLAKRADPWALAAQAGEVRGGADSDAVLAGALLGRAVRTVGQGRSSGLDGSAAALARVVRSQLLDGIGYRDPFSGAALTAAAAVAQLAEWRALIDANRPIAAVLGVARWKRVTMDALLWDGCGPVRHGAARAANALPPAAPGEEARVVAWRSRTAPALLAGLTARGVRVGEIEDGMIRSSGLGADCVPPLSVIVDMAGAHFDPGQPSELESLLQQGEIGSELIARAERLRQRLVSAGIGKYGRDAQGDAATECPAFARPAGTRRRVLVAAQVEDDRAVLLGGAGCTNRDLLVRARAAEPGAELVYRPHPDVEAGHRRGGVPEREILAIADSIDRATPMPRLLAGVDAIHVISSLAGFEALLRGVEVTTHGVPFYAGWGLTRDLGPIPARRSRRRGLDELVAATLIRYPRYLDPVTRLPCRAEVLVERLAEGRGAVGSPLVALRRAQGRLRRLWRGS